MLIYDRKKLGVYLRKQRIAAGLTQAEVSGRLGYSSPQFLSNIERGVSVTPLATLRKMRELYGMSSKVLVGMLLESSREQLMKALTK